jgi:hypothetical protein
MSDISYIHLTNDGAIFLISRDSGRMGWVTRSQLITELDKLKASDGTILYSMDPSIDPLPTIARETLALIKAYCLPIVFAREPHPDTNSDRNAAPLMLVGHEGREAMADDLIERGANLEVNNVDAYTALMYASNAGQSRLVEMLLGAGADPNVRASDNSTPLMFAAQHGHAEIVRQLIAAGADPSAHGNHGLSALGFAEQNGHVEVVQYLRSVATSESG